MKRNTWKVVAWICFIGYLYYILSQIKSDGNKKKKNHFNGSFRAAIVTLTRGDPIRLLNMLHSIEYFYPQSIDKYPVIIFYDPHGTDIQSSTINYVKSCVKLKLIFEKIILFSLMKNPSETIDRINHEIPTIHQRPIGYRFMCQFWSHTVFHHPLIKTNYDYIMRLDDDSYFLELFQYDLFQYAYDNNLDYIYRALAWDIPMSGPDFILPEYLRQYHNNCQSDCFPFQSYDAIYNNFFLARIQYWYEEPVDEFLTKLLLNDSILIYSLGDGNIHAVILTLASDIQRSQRIDFAYGHNIHIYGRKNKNYDLEHNYHNWFEILSNNSQYACQQLIIIEPYNKQLKYIPIK